MNLVLLLRTRQRKTPYDTVISGNIKYKDTAAKKLLLGAKQYICRATGIQRNHTPDAYWQSGSWKLLMCTEKSTDQYRII